jgi:hypothetical protein
MGGLLLLLVLVLQAKAARILAPDVACSIGGQVTGSDFTRENCYLIDTSRLVDFRGQSLHVLGCYFLRCRGEGAGNCIYCLAFTGEILIEGTEITFGAGNNGDIYTGNTAEKKCTLIGCNITYGVHQYNSCYSGEGNSGSNRMLTEMYNCSFLHCYMNAPYGAVAGYGPKWVIEGCYFENATGANNPADGSLFIRLLMTPAYDFSLIVRRDRKSVV